MGTLQPAQTRIRWNSAHNADYYGVIRFTAAFGVTGMILEHSFHTNTRMTTCWTTKISSGWQLRRRPPSLSTTA